MLKETDLLRMRKTSQVLGDRITQGNVSYFYRFVNSTNVALIMFFNPLHIY